MARNYTINRRVKFTFEGQPVVARVEGEQDYDGDGYSWSFSVSGTYGDLDLDEIEDEIREEIEDEAKEYAFEEAAEEADMEATYRMLRYV